MATHPHAGRSSTTSTTSTGSSSDDQWLRNFREAKQSILTMTTTPGSTPSSPQRRTAELNLGVGQLQHEIKSIVDMLQLERVAGEAEGREADDGLSKRADGQSGVLVKCVPAASPLSSSSPSSGVSSRASSPSSTSSSAGGEGEESSSSTSNNSSSRGSGTYPFNELPSLSSSPPPPPSHVPPFAGSTASNEPSSVAEHLQWPRQQHQQSWQQQQQPAPPSSMPSTRAAVHPTYLLAMVQEDEEQSRQQATRIQDLELALLETQQECEVAIASARLESHELKCMLRRMASESTFADIFQVYEAHIARLEQEVHMLRERNVHLEERRQQQQQLQQQRDIQGFRLSLIFEGQGEEGGEGYDCINDDDEEEERDDNIHHHGDSSPTRRGLLLVGTTTAAKASQSLMAGSDVYHHQGESGGHACTPSGINSKSKRSKSGDMNHVSGHGEAIGSATAAATAMAVALRGRIKDLQRQVGELKQETGELRRRERQFLVQKRMVETTWARVQKVQAMAKELEGSLASCRLEGARAEARLEEAEEEIQALRQREAALVLDRDKILLELDLVHRQLGSGGNRQDSGRRERR